MLAGDSLAMSSDGSPARSVPGAAGSAGQVKGSSSKTTSTSATDAGPRPGVSDTEITLCYLVPLTGAAPIPTTWDKGANSYWDYLRKHGGVHGRNVKLLVKDTESDPAKGLASARDCINEKAFAFVTLDRYQVENAIAKFLNEQGYPIILINTPATPAMEKGSDQVNSFAVSVGHRDQSVMIAEYLTGGDLAGKKIGVVWENVPDLRPLVDAVEDQLARRGVKPVADEAIDAQGNDYSSSILKLKRSDAQVVWMFTSVTPMVKFAQQSFAVAYTPIWFGNAPTWAFNAAAQIGNANGAMAGARAFSPWVALSNPAADTYKAAYRELYPNETPDDIGLVAWGFGEIMHAVLQSAGRNLGHNTFRAAFQNLDVVPKTWAPQRFGTGVRVGSCSVTEFRIDGDHFDQVGDFRTSF
ncbi:MAG: ABC transporter substrate-binding protein [Actinomycetota bacterium]